MKGQSGFDLVKDFCTDSDTQSNGFSCYADSTQLYVFGITRTQALSMPEHGYLAALDYSGNVLWTRKILEAKPRNNASTYFGIAKFDSANLVTFGTIMDPALNPPKVTWNPYMYVFGRNGDSVRYQAFVDSFHSCSINSF